MTEGKEQKKEEENLKPRCSNCHSTFIYIRIKDKEKVCRNCGYIENLKEVKS